LVLLEVSGLDWCWLRRFLESVLRVIYHKDACMSHEYQCNAWGTSMHAVARRRQGVAGDLEGVTGKVSGKEERAGAQRNDGSIVLAGGEGAPVVVVRCDEVLQLERGKGVRKL
jgi:hypothetical protein